RHCAFSGRNRGWGRSRKGLPLSPNAHMGFEACDERPPAADDPRGSGHAQLGELVFVAAEVVTDLVVERLVKLVDERRAAGAGALEVSLEDEDLVRERRWAARRALLCDR